MLSVAGTENASTQTMTTLESTVLSFESLRATDRRRHRRAQLDAPILIDNEKAWSNARCVDVSTGGVCVYADAILELGERVELYFELPNGVPVEALAEVVRQKDSCIALAFVRIQPRALLGLRSHCRRPQDESSSRHH
jgi:hypothetical protein